MNRIRLLPEPVANQIAAGEVIERPASVVKELVENALDAGARRITVEIEAGGRSLIRVTDDGWGMGRDDALLCLERHATSKIRQARDLEVITTMGFRGEALPSIASISRFTLTTRAKESNDPEATQVVVHGGKMLEVRSAGQAPGTTVEVRQLFYNLPARRKFLRTESTERSHVMHYLTLAALAYPQVGFTLRQDGRQVWQLAPVAASSSPAEGLRERLRSLLGDELSLLSVDYAATLPTRGGMVERDKLGESEEAESQLRVWGFIGAPGVSRATREDQHLFVNRRPIDHRGLNYALLEGYHTALMKGRYPVCCLFLEIDPASVDVNVHPAKREVRFRQDYDVRRQVTHAVRETILHFHSSPETLVPPTATTFAVSSASPGPAPPQTASPTPEKSDEVTEEVAAPDTSKELALEMEATGSESKSGGFGSRQEPDPGAEPPRTPVATPVGDSGTASAETRSNAGSVSGPTSRSPAAPLLQVPLRLIGVVGRLYVLLESDRGLVLMDQHAAHERVLYEQMLRRLEQQDTPSQRLLLPETVELSVRDTDFLRENLGVLSRLGVGLSEFGEKTFLLDALPPFVKTSDAKRFVRELIDELVTAGQQLNSMRLGEAAVAKTVCRHAVKANDPLSALELEQLLADLRMCAMPYTCPHGRPTLVEMSYRELERKFGRIQ